MLDFITSNPTVEDAVKVIVDSGLNRIICSATGVPYASIDEEEIRLTVQADFLAHFNKLTGDNAVDRLIDMWEVRHWTISSRPSPSYRLLTDKSIVSMLSSKGEAGYVRLFGFLFNRMFRLPGDADFLTRDQFDLLRVFHESLDGEVDFPKDGAATVVFNQLLQVDAIRSISAWHRNVKFMATYRERLTQFRDQCLVDWKVDFTAFSGLINDMHGYALDWAAKQSTMAESQGNRLTVRAVAVAADAASKVTLDILSSAIAAERLQAKQSLQSTQSTGPRMMGRIIGDIKRKAMTAEKAKAPATPTKPKKPVDPNKPLTIAQKLANFSFLK